MKKLKPPAVAVYPTQDDHQCLTHELWTDLSRQIHDFLMGISLGQLVENQGVQEVAARQEQDHKESNGSNETVVGVTASSNA